MIRRSASFASASARSAQISMKQFNSGCNRSARANTARVISSGEISLAPIRRRSSPAERRQGSSLVFKSRPNDHPAPADQASIRTAAARSPNWQREWCSHDRAVKCRFTPTHSVSACPWPSADFLHLNAGKHAMACLSPTNPCCAIGAPRICCGPSQAQDRQRFPRLRSYFKSWATLSLVTRSRPV